MSDPEGARTVGKDGTAWTGRTFSPSPSLADELAELATPLLTAQERDTVRRAVEALQKYKAIVVKLREWNDRESPPDVIPEQDWHNFDVLCDLCELTKTTNEPTTVTNTPRAED